MGLPIRHGRLVDVIRAWADIYQVGHLSITPKVNDARTDTNH